MSDEEIIDDAIGMHPECAFGRVENGLTAFFQMTRVVLLWRNEDCYLAGDPPRHTVQGYPS